MSELLIEIKECSVEGCHRPARNRGLCHSHIERLRLGRPLEAPMKPRAYESLQQAFESNTETTEHGLIWTGTIRNGYGTVHYDHKTYTAHRLAWELVNGPIPEYHELDHDLECPRNCVTVEHLTPRTKSDHARIGWERGQFEGNGWSEEARIKRTKFAYCILCGKDYIRDIKSKYCSKKCSIKAGNLKRKERQLGLDPGTLCPTLEFDTFARKKVWEEEDGICGICGTLAAVNDWHLDHIIPRSKGGPHIRSNVQVSHPKCNLKKGNRIPEKYCGYCGVEFERGPKAIYCSQDCCIKADKARIKARKGSRIRFCEYCGVKFERGPKAIYCSSSCGEKFRNEGRKLQAECGTIELIGNKTP